MKFFFPPIALLLAPAWVAAQADDPCVLCPAGLEVADDTPIPGTGGGDDDDAEAQTCAQLSAAVGFFEAGSVACDSFTLVPTAACCPSQFVAAADPCLVCPDDLEVPADTVVESEEDGLQWGDTTCGTGLLLVGSLAADFSLCPVYRLGVATTCCPSDAAGAAAAVGAAAAEAAALFGDGGGSGDIGGGNGGDGQNGETACEIDSGAPSHSRDECLEVGCCQWDDGQCFSAVGDGQCSDGEGSGDMAAELGGLLGGLFGDGTSGASCDVCPTGLEVPDDTAMPDLGDDDSEPTTCALALAGGALVDGDSPMCESFRAAVSATCCPAQAVAVEDPCLPCPDGLEVDEDVPVDEEEEEAPTCGGALTMAGMYSADSPVCPQWKSLAYTCCPSQTGPGCEFCPEGLADPDKVLSGIADFDGTCSDVEDQVATISADDPSCGQLGIVQVLCCSGAVAQAADPCPVCPDGVADDRAELKIEEYTCNDLVAYAKTLDREADECADLDDVEIACCPTLAENACAVCPNGITGKEEEMIPSLEASCEEAMLFLVTLEASDESCPEVQSVTEAVCCPPENEENEDTATTEENDTSASAAPKDEENETTAKTEETVSLAPPNANATASADDKSPPAPELGDEDAKDSDSENGAAAVGWGKAAVPTVVTAMLVLFA